MPFPLVANPPASSFDVGGLPFVPGRAMGGFVPRSPVPGVPLVRDPVSGRLKRLDCPSVPLVDAGQGIPIPGSAKRSGDGDSLPCQYSNNSIEKPSKLTPYQRKNAHSINENLGFCVERFGLGKIGFLTLTFPKDIPLKEANRRFNSLASNVLDKLFECWVCVREFTKGGRPHFHLIVVCRDEIREGFHFENYTRLAWLTSRPERRRKFSHEIKALSRSLTPCPALKALWGELRRVLPLYQFGRHELTPIRKSGAALARYVGGYIRKSMDFRPVEAKGARMVTYSKGFPRKVVGHAWSFHCEGSEHWRAKVAVFAKLHRVRDLDHMKARFGNRWAWWLKDLISSLNLLPSLSYANCEEDASAAVSRYINGSDNEAFSLAVDSGVHVLALHLSPPCLPEVPGLPDLQPPKRLRAVFDFHLSSWSLTASEIAERSDSDRRRMAAFRESGQVFHTREAVEQARASLLFRHPLAVKPDHAERSANFSRLVHPEYYKDHYPENETSH